MNATVTLTRSQRPPSPPVSASLSPGRVPRAIAWVEAIRPRIEFLQGLPAGLSGPGSEPLADTALLRMYEELLPVVYEYLDGSEPLPSINLSHEGGLVLVWRAIGVRVSLELLPTLHARLTVEDPADPESSRPVDVTNDLRPLLKAVADVKQRLADRPIWTALEQDGPEESSSEHLGVLIRGLEGLIERGQISELSATLEGLQPTKYSLAALITVLRTTFVVRSHCSAWQAARDRVAEEVARRGHNPESLLIGLLGN